MSAVAPAKERLCASQADERRRFSALARVCLQKVGMIAASLVIYGSKVACELQKNR
jgi:hypothetical protein